ncbi:GumC family protein [Merismopedia glauca]|uniref:Capsular biosynthesis protein n=1 Tax=Merismopedia glauca CCAP 1448/3 TaxID=1296344 RepID=A0A2T1BZ43_9CYAN|nr:polysaccharide biosynthesis tyrosine autokinase [Merismopedia glauca]PSB01305.1 capsular biosynthesis protein [Merismopedia glauca CCAP 1448/3]
MNTGKSSQSLPLVNSIQFSQVDEGGLNLGQFLAAIRRRLLLITGITALVATAGLAKALTEPPIYEDRFEILTEPVTGESQVISSVPQTLTNKERPVKLGLDETKLLVLQSPKVLAPIYNQLQAVYPDLSYGRFLRKLNIQPLGKDTNILQVSYRGNTPEEVQQALNLISQAYLDYSREERQTDVRQGIKFVEDQLPKLRSRVEIQQTELQKLRQQNNLVDPETKAQELSAQISTLVQQRLDVKLQLDQLRSRYQDLQQELAGQPGSTAGSLALRDNPRYQKVLDQVQLIDAEIARQSTRFSGTNPIIEDLNSQKQNLLPILKQEQQRVVREMEAQIRELQTRFVTLNQNTDSLDRQLKQLPGLSRNYNNINQELKIATENLSQFLAKREALAIEEAQTQVPWQLLTPPQVPQPSNASLKNYLLVGTILGLLLGTAIALLLDKLSNVIYTPKELKTISGLPLLGVIPWQKDLKEYAPAANMVSPGEQSDHSFGFTPANAASKYNVTPFFEAFRFFFTNIRLLGSDTVIRSLIVSSSLSGDGKSTVAAHLAQAAAVMGQRVLLVDADLRHPSVHQRMGLMNIQGLTDAISALDTDFNKVIQRSPLEENLFVLTAGLTPPDPVRLLASTKMQELMANFQNEYDLVIYDTPPLLECADAYQLADRTDGIVLVTALGKLKRSFLEQTLEELKVSGRSVLGIVANLAKPSAIGSLNYPKSSISEPDNLDKADLISLKPSEAELKDSDFHLIDKAKSR